MSKPEHVSSSCMGAFEAKTHFSELLARVAKGEEVTITRHGSPVAKVVPVRRKTTRAERRAAIEAMRRLAASSTLGELKVKDLIAEGRP